MKNKQKKLVLTALVLIILLAGFLRIWGIDFGLPSKYHPDEEFFINPAFSVISLEAPGWYGAPGTTVIYANAIIFTVVGNFIDSQKPILEQYQENPAPFILASRILMVLISMATVLLVYLLAKNIFKNKYIGLLSALALALSALHIEHSHYIRPDIMVVFFLVLTAYFSWLIFEKAKMKHYILAFIFLALAIATKYPAVFGIIFILIGHFYNYSSDKKIKLILNKKLLIGLLAGLIIFLAVFPYIISDYSQIISDLKWEARYEHAGADQLGLFGNFEFYVSGSLWYTGTMILIASIIGIIFSFFQRKKGMFFLFPFLVIFLGFISALSLHWDRWALILIPFGSIFAGLGIVATFRYIRFQAENKFRLKNKIIWIILATIAIIIIFYPALLRSFRQSYAFAHNDTRDAAQEWITNNLPSDSVAVIEDYGPNMDNYFQRVLRPWTAAQKFPGYWERDESADYEIVSSWIYQRILDGPEDWQYYKDGYNYLFDTRKLLQEFIPEPSRKNLIEQHDFYLLFDKDILNFKLQNGPQIKIYEL